MKKIKKRTAFLIIFTGLVFVSCETSDDSDGLDDMVSIEQVKSTVESGSWQVALYEEDGVDETSYFSDHIFVFQSDGVLTADNGETSVSGAWSITSDSNSSDDDSSSDDDVDFNIFFASPANFAEISEDWDIVSFSNTRIELRDESGGDGSIDRLVFEKI